MPTFALLAAACSAFCGAQAAESDVQLRETWEKPYAASDMTGSHVLGLWTFDDEDSGLDASSHRCAGKLEGAKVDPQGRFGACLRTLRGWPIEDRRHRLLVPHDPSLTPKGPFTIELWFNADDTLADYPQAFLVDKKYVADDDYQLILQRAERNGLRCHHRICCSENIAISETRRDRDWRRAHRTVYPAGRPVNKL